MTDARPEIVQVAELPPWTSERLESLFAVHRLWQQPDHVAYLKRSAAGARGVATLGNIRFERGAMDALPALEIVSCFGVGVDGVDVAHARSRGVLVTNTPDVLTDCVADFALALLLGICRRVVEGDRYVRAGHWLKANLHLGASPRGKVLGIVGFGRIGRAVAKRAEAFGMRIAYHGPNRKEAFDYPYYHSAAALAAACDILVLTCPGGAATRHLVDTNVLQALGPKGLLVNVARGSVVDEAALVDALLNRRIAGAALDVFTDEPTVPAALMDLETVILEPHQASATVETRTAMGDLMIDNLVRHFAGQPPLTPV